MGAQKNRLIETVLLSTHNICFGKEIKKIVFQYSLLSGALYFLYPLVPSRLLAFNYHYLLVCVDALWPNQQFFNHFWRCLCFESVLSICRIKCLPQVHNTCLFCCVTSQVNSYGHGGMFVWFDSLHPINNLSVKQGQVFLGWTSTKLG